DSGSATATATVEVAWEPQLRPLQVETRPQGLRLVADGGTHRPERDAGSSLSPVDGLTAFSFDVPLPAVERKWLSIQRVEGSLTGGGRNGGAALPFDSPARLARPDRWYRPPAKRSARAEGAGARVGDVKILNDRWTVKLRVDAPAGAERFDSAEAW